MQLSGKRLPLEEVVADSMMLAGAWVDPLAFRSSAASGTGEFFSLKRRCIESPFSDKPETQKKLEAFSHVECMPEVLSSPYGERVLIAGPGDASSAKETRTFSTPHT